MHVLGKVLLGLVVVLAIAAVFLTTMTLDVRTHWEQQVAEAKATYANLEKDLATKQANARDAQQTLDRVKLNWGNVWLGQNSRVTNPATGGVSIGVGTQQGLGVPAASRSANPVVHLFNVVDNENSEYLGAFKVQQAQAGSTEAVLNRPPFGDENFPAGNWRVRELIPFDYATREIDLYTKQIEADARLQRMTFDVQRLNEQHAKTQTLLQERIYQLDGDPNEGTTGFVQGIRDSLTERDDLLAKLHRLRIERLLKFETLTQLNDENRARLELFARQSSGATTPTTAATADTDRGTR
ncbi:MAG: hypothetical protein ACK5Q5_15980 [Planctomycetaceae bacterium]